MSWSADDGREKVTAGIAGLSPSRRKQVETVERTREQSSRALADQIERDAATVAPDGRVDTTNSLAQLGRPLTTYQLTQRLRRMNSNLVFEVSKSDPTKMGIYVPDYERDDLTQSWRRVKRFVCGMENGFMPEFSVRHYVEESVPADGGEWQTVRRFVRETRGWRTILARLLRARLVTESQIRECFDILGGRGSANWQGLTT